MKHLLLVVLLLATTSAYAECPYLQGNYSSCEITSILDNDEVRSNISISQNGSQPMFSISYILNSIDKEVNIDAMADGQTYWSEYVDGHNTYPQSIKSFCSDDSLFVERIVKFNFGNTPSIHTSYDIYRKLEFRKNYNGSLVIVSYDKKRVISIAKCK